MLRDLIAAVVTERADVIAGFKTPGELFKGEAESISGDRRVRVSKVARGVAGREILLACATNAAAQNVSLELPDLGAIDAEWRADAGYLADFATAALRAGALSDLRFGEGEAGGGGRARAGARGNAGSGARIGGGADADAGSALTLDGFDALASPPPSDDPHALQAWGLVAARLGRRSYCKDFAGAVWWGTAPRPGDRGSWGQAPRVAPTDPRRTRPGGAPEHDAERRRAGGLGSVAQAVRRGARRGGSASRAAAGCGRRAGAGR